jgi:hypothetical protein
MILALQWMMERTPKALRELISDQENHYEKAIDIHFACGVCLITRMSVPGSFENWDKDCRVLTDRFRSP